MAELIYDEMELFVVCFLLGVGLALVYDGMRVLRLMFGHWDWLVDVEDLLYWIFTAWMVFQTLFHYNQGLLRGYAFLGMFVGVVLYSATVSRLLLGLVRKLLPYWNRMKHCIRKPIVKIQCSLRKTLKNIALEVTMAMKSR